MKPILLSRRHTGLALLSAAAVVFLLVDYTIAQNQPGPLEWFDGRGDIGTVQIPGSAEYDAAKKELKLTGSGENVWAAEDDMYFAWKKVSGDLDLSADIALSAGTVAHRKGGWFIRGGLEKDDPYVGVSFHADGTINLHWRKVKGGITYEVIVGYHGPATIRLERAGDIFTGYYKKPGGAYQPIGSVVVALPDPVYAGVFACSHEAAKSVTATYTNIGFDNKPAGTKKRLQRTNLETLSVETVGQATGERKIIFQANEKFEAPNWSGDGKLVYFNKGGAIYTLPIDGGTPTKLNTGTATNCNNDHGLSFDGRWLAVSSKTGPASQIFILPAIGGEAKQLTKGPGPSFWHGWAPDGKSVLYCAQRNDNFDVYSMAIEGGEEKRLTEAEGLDDGPEYSPDGKWIYFNSERSGSMQVWKMNPDGTNPQQVTKDDGYHNWFAHPSPDGKLLAFVSFEKTVKANDHPPNQPVLIRVMPAQAATTKKSGARTVATLFGGQGTLNVPSWSPDSKQLAFVSYVPVLP